MNAYFSWSFVNPFGVRRQFVIITKHVLFLYKYIWFNTNANLENEIADLEFEAKQDVPHTLSSEEAAVYYNQNKTHSTVGRKSKRAL